MLKIQITSDVLKTILSTPLPLTLGSAHSNDYVIDSPEIPLSFFQISIDEKEQLLLEFSSDFFDHIQSKIQPQLNQSSVERKQTIQLPAVLQFLNFSIEFISLRSEMQSTHSNLKINSTDSDAQANTETSTHKPIETIEQNFLKNNQTIQIPEQCWGVLKPLEQYQNLLPLIYLIDPVHMIKLPKSGASASISFRNQQVWFTHIAGPLPLIGKNLATKQPQILPNLQFLTWADGIYQFLDPKKITS